MGEKTATPLLFKAYGNWGGGGKNILQLLKLLESKIQSLNFKVTAGIYIPKDETIILLVLEFSYIMGTIGEYNYNYNISSLGIFSLVSNKPIYKPPFERQPP